MKKAFLIVAVSVLGGCATPPPRPSGIEPGIRAALEPAAKKETPSAALDQALLPPLRMAMPEVRGQPVEPRFDLSVNNAPAAQVFNSIVSGTRYSMLVPPSVSGTISVNLKDVSITEALDSIRELYGYDYKIEGTRIFILPAGLQTRIFQVNYLQGQRRGTSEVRVQSGSISDTTGINQAPTPSSIANPTAGPVQTPGQNMLESSRVTTRTLSDFWGDLRTALVAIVGSGEGRNVVVSPQSGIVLVSAPAREMRAVRQYLRESQISVERQVMLEAKIIQVTLSDSYQSGINWSAFRSTGPNVAIGQSANTGATTVLGSSGQVLQGGGQTLNLNTSTVTTAASSLAADNPASGVFGLAFQTSNFAALLQFLQSQGNVQVLSSPRIATLNNQKAVLKVGTDQFFVTNVATVTTTTGATTQQTPTVSVAPFFSGILLDVTPQIDDQNNITLHVHPSISDVTTSETVVNLGGTVPSITLPLAKSTVSETDTIVRVPDGNIVAIGGLMSVNVSDNRGGIPGVTEGGLGDLVRNTSRTTSKNELVILIKPTVIESDRNWADDMRDTRERIEGMASHQNSEAPRQ
ncbi:MAG TPA: secretin N-terminal domain-containing protein [Burkholderiales bacterium]|nr:secretin N-terminal domain-containing protein [Burkholderiales bacterium]